MGTFTQTHSFQANYWRDPRPQAKDAYAYYSQLAQWNNEGRVYNSTLNENYAKTQKFVWVMALKDKMVWPKEGEHWGAQILSIHLMARIVSWIVRRLNGSRRICLV